MSLPAETKFPCTGMPDRDWTKVRFETREELTFEVREGRQIAGAFLDRAQVESLRDQLTEWLEVTK